MPPPVFHQEQVHCCTAAVVLWTSQHQAGRLKAWVRVTEWHRHSNNCDITKPPHDLPCPLSGSSCSEQDAQAVQTPENSLDQSLCPYLLSQPHHKLQMHMNKHLPLLYSIPKPIPKLILCWINTFPLKDNPLKIKMNFSNCYWMNCRTASTAYSVWVQVE